MTNDHYPRLAEPRLGLSYAAAPQLPLAPERARYLMSQVCQYRLNGFPKSLSATVTRLKPCVNQNSFKAIPFLSLASRFRVASAPGPPPSHPMPTRLVIQPNAKQL